MSSREILRIVIFIALLGLVIAGRRWPWLRRRKFDWRFFRSKKNKSNGP